MSNILKLFLISLVISLPIWWGANLFQQGFENYLFAKTTVPNSQVLTAEMVGTLLNPPQKELNIQAKSAFSILTEEGQQGWTVVYEQNEKLRLPIASLTKLMTALVVLENYDLNQQVMISKAAVDQDETIGQLRVGEILSVKDLLYMTLIESSNDAAYALSELIGVNNFIEVMNWQAKNMGLKNTHFVNPNGLDDPKNYSSAQDLAILIKNLLSKPLLWNILQTSEYKVYMPEGKLHHMAKNTNILLGEESQWQNKIYGGKTGWTLDAKGCLALVIKDGGSYLINIILGADDRFGEMKNLINNEL